MASLTLAIKSALVVVLVASISFLVGHEMSDKAAAGTSTTCQPAVRPAVSQNASEGDDVHVYFLLDRSGSMQAIASDVIGGFNAFVEEQRLTPGHLRMTLIQFDAQDPHELVFAGRDIKDVAPLTSDRFKPRGATPLFDAVGETILMAEKAQAEMEHVVVVTFSDGKENASQRHSRKSIFDRIAAKRELGWTFVFLGANQDSYAEGGSLGYSGKNTQNFAFDGEGAHAAFKSVSSAMTNMRHKLRSAVAEYDSEDFFEGEKSAEKDYMERSYGK